MDKSDKVVLKSIEVPGYRVELVSESQGAVFRVNVRDDDGHPKTRVFTDYAEASRLFDSYAEGN